MAHSFAENELAPSESLWIHDQNAKPINPKIGKYLEWLYIRHIGRAANCMCYQPLRQHIDIGTDQGTEWHKLRVRKSKNVYLLCRALQNLLELFPTYDWTGKHAFADEIGKIWDFTCDPLGEFDDIAQTYFDDNGLIQRY